MMILVVDDTINNLIVMKFLFESIKDIDLEVKSALNGELAVQVV